MLRLRTTNSIGLARDGEFISRIGSIIPRTIFGENWFIYRAQSDLSVEHEQDTRESNLIINHLYVTEEVNDIWSFVTFNFYIAEIHETLIRTNACFSSEKKHLSSLIVLILQWYALMKIVACTRFSFPCRFISSLLAFLSRYCNCNNLVRLDCYAYEYT